MTLAAELLEILACPEDKGPLYYFADESRLYNPRLRRSYAIDDGIPVLLIDQSVTVDDTERARAVLQALPGVDGTEVEDQQVHVDLAGVAPTVAIAALLEAGIAVSSAAPRNRLEDVFLDLVGATGMGGS